MTLKVFVHLFTLWLSCKTFPFHHRQKKKKKERPPPFKFCASRYFELTLRPKSEQDKRDQHPQVAPEAFHCQTKHWVMRPAVRHKKERRDLLVFLFNCSVFSSSQCDFYTSCFSELRINLVCIISTIKEKLFLVY